MRKTRCLLLSPFREPSFVIGPTGEKSKEILHNVKYNKEVCLLTFDHNLVFMTETVASKVFQWYAIIFRSKPITHEKLFES